MTDNTRIDIVSDVMCPWCLIGYKRLEKAISEMGIEDRVEIEWHPFELNPAMPAEGEDLCEHLGKKYGITMADSIGFQAQLASLGAELGFTFDFFEGMKIVNTRDAHILLEYANEYGKQTALKMRLFEAFFTERKDVSDRDVLAQQARHVGLNVEEALLRLDDPAAQDRTQAREAHWHRMGVNSVPAMVFNRSSALIGAQPVADYKALLAELIEP